MKRNIGMGFGGKNFKLEIIFVYSIGRSGTSYLYQVFGNKKWKTQDIAYPDERTSVVHEKWILNNDEISKLKLVKPTSEEGLKIQEKKIKRINSMCRMAGTDRLLNTDSTFGRWCPYYIINNYKYKAIFLDRNRDDVIKSWVKMYRNYTSKYGKKRTKELIADRFRYNYFNITDKYTLLHVDKKTWKKYSLQEKIGWYYDETIAKWNELKKEMDPENYIETSYEKVITIEGIKELSDFIKIPFNYELMKHKINTSKL